MESITITDRDLEKIGVKLTQLTPR